jgi:hypothetical protein
MKLQILEKARNISPSALTFALARYRKGDKPLVAGWKGARFDDVPLYLRPLTAIIIAWHINRHHNRVNKK